MPINRAASAGLTATGTANDPAPASDILAAQQTLRDDLQAFPWYPLIKFGMNYRF